MTSSTAATTSRVNRRGLVAALLTVFMSIGLAGFVPAAAHAAPEGSADLHVDAYLVDAKYRGIAVDIKVLNGAVTDATEIRVTIEREVGPDVVKVSKAPTVATLNGGSSVTAPMVIQPGTYDEAGSTSWVKPEGAIWTAETVPTAIIVEVLNEAGVALSETVGIPTTGPTNATLADVMPAPATLTPIGATLWQGAKYKGIVVEFRVSGFSDAEQAYVTVGRSDGSSIVKVAKQSVLDRINSGATEGLSAPIVIQQGTYDEAGSTSWYMPTGVWTSETVPTSVTVTIVRTYGPDAVWTWDALGGSIDGILPAPSAPVVITVPEDQPDGGSFDVVIPEGQTGGELVLGEVADASVTVPVEVNIVSPTGVTVTLPKDVTITATGPGADEWDGVLQLPTVVDDVEIPGSADATVGLAIEVGSDTVRLTFDKPVKLVLAGQAGQKAAFVQGGVFTAIDTACSSSEPTDLVNGECWLNEGDDLVIWTTHFTTFVAYGVAAATLPATGSADAGAALVLVGILLFAGLALVLVRRRATA